MTSDAAMAATIPAKLDVTVVKYLMADGQEKAFVEYVDHKQGRAVLALLKDKAGYVDEKKIIKAAEYISKHTRLHIDLSRDFTVTASEVIGRDYPMPNRFPPALSERIRTFTICEPYLQIIYNDTSETHFLRRMTLTFTLEDLPHLGKKIWEVAIPKWEMRASDFPHFEENEQVISRVDCEIELAVTAHVEGIVQTQNTHASEPEKLKPEFMWNLQRAMVFENTKEREVFGWKVKTGKREEAARLYRVATWDGEGDWVEYES